jgi:hypothetical protein
LDTLHIASYPLRLNLKIVHLWGSLLLYKGKFLSLVYELEDTSL